MEWVHGDVLDTALLEEAMEGGSPLLFDIRKKATSLFFFAYYGPRVNLLFQPERKGGSESKSEQKGSEQRNRHGYGKRAEEASSHLGDRDQG